MKQFLEQFTPKAVAEKRCALMGIVNLTPDSFSDGGRHNQLDAAVAWSEKLLADGADLLDLGAESTRPGFNPGRVGAEEEKARLIPVVRALRKRFPECVLSIDTRKAIVAQAALDEGADIINDVSSFEDPGMLDIVRRYSAGLVLMSGYREHIGARPRAAESGSLGAWVADNLRIFRDQALAAGIAAEKLCLDPGFGFGLKRADNAEVLRSTADYVREFAPMPILIGPSRKHFLLAQYPEAGDDIDEATRLFCEEAANQGAQIFRVHDVARHRGLRRVDQA